MEIESRRDEIIRRVQKIADTDGTQINAAEVSRVASLTLDECIREIDEVTATLSRLSREADAIKTMLKRKGE